MAALAQAPLMCLLFWAPRDPFSLTYGREHPAALPGGVNTRVLRSHGHHPRNMAQGARARSPSCPPLVCGVSHRLLSTSLLLWELRAGSVHSRPQGHLGVPRAWARARLLQGALLAVRPGWWGQETLFTLSRFTRQTSQGGQGSCPTFYPPSSSAGNRGRF